MPKHPQLKVAVIGRDGLEGRLIAGAGLAYAFLTPRAAARAPLAEYDALLVELGPRAHDARLRGLRRRASGAIVASVSRGLAPDTLRRSQALGFDFHVASWAKGDPPAREVAVLVSAARERRARRRRRDARRHGLAMRRLTTLVDVVKTANSILEPRKLIELIMGKVQELIPSQAWSILMVDEARQRLTFEAALGERASDVASQRVEMGEGIAGWVAETGQPVIVNDVKRDPRFSDRFDNVSRFRTRSILCAPLVSRGRTIGVVEIINRRGGRFTGDDLDSLLTLVEPCAIALENAMLFQRAEQLTITDDLTQLFNSRYLTLYLSREIKRCRRHGVPLSLIFLDLDGFKGVNDSHGHLAGSSTLGEVGALLASCVRESDILARYGGDEFVVVLPETPAAGALVIAERIRKTIESHPFLTSQALEVRISASFGIASFPDHATTPEGLIQKADQAMYKVKEADKNAVRLAV